MQNSVCGRRIVKFVRDVLFNIKQILFGKGINSQLMHETILLNLPSLVLLLTIHHRF